MVGAQVVADLVGEGEVARGAPVAVHHRPGASLGVGLRLGAAEGAEAARGAGGVLAAEPQADEVGVRLLAQRLRLVEDAVAGGLERVVVGQQRRGLGGGDLARAHQPHLRADARSGQALVGLGDAERELRLHLRRPEPRGQRGGVDDRDVDHRRGVRPGDRRGGRGRGTARGGAVVVGRVVGVVGSGLRHHRVVAGGQRGDLGHLVAAAADAADLEGAVLGGGDAEVDHTVDLRGGEGADVTDEAAGPRRGAAAGVAAVDRRGDGGVVEERQR